MKGISKNEDTIQYRKLLHNVEEVLFQLFLDVLSRNVFHADVNIGQCYTDLVFATHACHLFALTLLSCPSQSEKERGPDDPRSDYNQLACFCCCSTTFLQRLMAPTIQALYCEPFQYFRIM